MIRWQLLAALAVACPTIASAQSLYHRDSWPALASDRRAAAVGDILTVIVMENNTASNSVQTGTTRDSRLSANISAGHTGSGISEAGALGLGGSFAGNGQTARSGRMVAQLSVRVDAVYPNGDLAVSGAEALNINRERTNIRIRGRVRSADIAGDNTIPSNRLADAQIDYDGSGFVSRSARPGLFQRIFSFLGLM